MTESVKPYPWTCGACCTKNVRPVVAANYKTQIEHDGRLYDITVEDLPVHQCHKCYDILLGEEASRRVSEAFREAAGLLAPEHIAAEREAMGLSQKELARALGVKEVTVRRWEDGTQIQQRAMDKLLRLFFHSPESREFLTSLAEACEGRDAGGARGDVT
jgi:putative zinc finger/helix-turn-helix YgiT family protein